MFSLATSLVHTTGSTGPENTFFSFYAEFRDEHFFLLCSLNEWDDLSILLQELHGYSRPSMCFSTCSLRWPICFEARARKLSTSLPLQDIESLWLQSNCLPSPPSCKSGAEDVNEFSAASWRMDYKSKEPLCGPWCCGPHRLEWHQWSRCQFWVLQRTLALGPKNHSISGKAFRLSW